MQEIIKKIRLYLNMSQLEFADQLQVTFATVNRWENGRSIPNKSAQEKLYDMCYKNQVPVYNMILEKITDMAEQIVLEPGRILLYHGSKSGVKGKIAPKSRRQCDFGQGFYMGTEPSQPLTLICDYESAKFYIVSVQMNQIEKMEVPANIEWAMFVAYHRGRMDHIQGTSFYNKYHHMAEGKDLIIGNIADDRMFYVIDNFFIGNITDQALVNSLAALELGKQYVAVTEKACQAVKIEAEVPLSYFEKKFIQEVAGENRAKGVSLANQICRDHRREGLFFDEILEKAAKQEENVYE